LQAKRERKKEEKAKAKVEKKSSFLSIEVGPGCLGFVSHFFFAKTFFLSTSTSTTTKGQKMLKGLEKNSRRPLKA
jgi:hypothetical protein